MAGRAITSFVIWLLNISSLSMNDRTRLTAALLDKLNAFPAADIIKIDEKYGLLVNGVQIDVEKARLLRESAKAAFNSRACRLVWDAVAFKAVAVGVHNGDSPERVMFSKAALWWSQQEMELFSTLAQE